MGEDRRLRAVVELAQGMAAAHTPRESWRAAALGACHALDGSFAALSVWERELGRLRVLANVGERAEGEEEFPEGEAYPVHQFPEITEFLHERWAGGGEPDAWVETAEGPAGGPAGYCHQRVAALRRRGRGCCVVAPIVLHGRAWGELYVARRAGAPFSSGPTQTSRPSWPRSSRPGSRRPSGWRRPGGWRSRTPSPVSPTAVPSTYGSTRRSNATRRTRRSW